MNVVKTRISNRFVQDSIMRIRIHFSAHKKGCKDFTPSPSMIKDFILNVVYDQNKNFNDGDTVKEELTEEHCVEMYNIIEEIDAEIRCISLPDYFF